MNNIAITDIVRHDKDEQGRHVLHVGTVKVVPIYNVNDVAFLIARAAHRAFTELGVLLRPGAVAACPLCGTTENGQFVTVPEPMPHHAWALCKCKECPIRRGAP